MQVSLFTVAPGDSRALDELNRCLRRQRVLTLDRHCEGAPAISAEVAIVRADAVGRPDQ